MIETSWKSLGLEHLPVIEKILIVESLLQELDSEASSQPIPSSHVAELQRRIAESKTRPDEGFTWDEIKAELESELSHNESD